MSDENGPSSMDQPERWVPFLRENFLFFNNLLGQVLHRFMKQVFKHFFLSTVKSFSEASFGCLSQKQAWAEFSQTSFFGEENLFAKLPNSNWRKSSAGYARFDKILLVMQNFANFGQIQPILDEMLLIFDEIILQNLFLLIISP